MLSQPTWVQPSILAAGGVLIVIDGLALVVLVAHLDAVKGGGYLQVRTHFARSLITLIVTAAQVFALYPVLSAISFLYCTAPELLQPTARPRISLKTDQRQLGGAIAICHIWFAIIWAYIYM